MAPPPVAAPAAGTMPIPGPGPNTDQLKKEVDDLLKDEDSDEEDKDTRPPSPDPVATPVPVPRTPMTMRNKTLNKLGRTALIGLWGSSGFDDMAKPRWRYFWAGQPVPSDPQLILKVSHSLVLWKGPWSEKGRYLWS